MRLVEGGVSDKLSGFQHNAVTPIGMATPLPVIIDKPITELPQSEFWLGGGEVDLKLRLPVAVALEGFGAQAFDLSTD